MIKKIEKINGVEALTIASKDKKKGTFQCLLYDIIAASLKDRIKTADALIVTVCAC